MSLQIRSIQVVRATSPDQSRREGEMGMKHSTRTHGQDALSLAIALALAAAVIPAGAAAQQAASTGSQDAATLDSVQVTGYRYAIEKSLEQKRDANAVVEVITAEDVGKFPDKNVADALQRVPGVVITRSGGEGKSVSVRGLAPDLTLTQLNGNYVATSETNDEATRSFNYTLLPSNMLSSAELFKSPEARIDEGGIGGTVILHTRRVGAVLVAQQGRAVRRAGRRDPAEAHHPHHGSHHRGLPVVWRRQGA
ncbi:hypothetical protein G6F22_016022 [Rhizopus arrhizus]|nr:hypothetical protein G6F22_016022 [Rhizopus arrhizus]